MTKTKRLFSFLSMAVMFLLLSVTGYSQVTQTYDFNLNSTGWTGNITRTTATTACGSPSMRRNLYASVTTGNMVSPLIGTTTGGSVDVTYKYKVANWSANTVGTPNPWGSFNVQYGPSATGPWTTVQTINSTNHIVSATCTTATVNFTPTGGQPLYIKWDAVWATGSGTDYYLNFDDVVVAINAGSPCAGTPTPGNTLATVSSSCDGTPTTLSLQTQTIGTGVTYDWQSADDAAFTTNVTTGLGAANTLATVIPATPRYYRCLVTCATGPASDYSTPVLLSPVAPNPGNTLVSVPQGCPQTPFTISLQNAVAGTASYVWQSADDNLFTVGLTTLGTTAVPTFAMTGQSASKYYRCIVTCAGAVGTATSTEVFLPQGAPTQCYCNPNYTVGKTDGDLISNVVITGTTLANNTGTSPVNPFYTYFPASLGPTYTCNLVAGNTYNVTVSIGSFSNQGVAAWIDYNQDGSFGTNEKIGGTNGTILTAFGSGVFPVTISCNPLPGTYRMRVRGVYATSGLTIDPCATYSWGECEDYDVTIDPALPCPAPSAFAVTAGSQTTTGATFTWVNGCVETNWDIEFGPTGFTPGTGTIESVTTNPATTTTFPCGTTLDVYLLANCLGNGYSTYVGPISVTTLSCPCTGTPPAANTLASIVTACPGAPFTLSLDYNYSGLSGITYQWESASDIAFTTPVALGTGTTETIANQTVATYYRCNITCTSGPTTIQSTPIFVDMSLPTQCYCDPTYTVGKTDGDLISNVEITGTTLANNTGTSPVNPYYTYFPASLGPTYTCNLVAGNTYNVTVAIGSFSNQGVAAWIDYNQDGVFATSEKIGGTNGTILTSFGTGVFPVTISCNPLPGTYRMRVRGVYATSGLVIDPCATYSFGECEDYDVTIDPALPCPAPSAFALTPGSITPTGASFSWNNGCVETDWEFEFGPTGFTPSTGTVEAVTSNPASITTMLCNTAYDVYLRANCLTNGYSTYVGPIAVTTGPCPCTGSPAQASVTGPATVCQGANFTLALDVNYSGTSGITYQWESADDALFTTGLTTLGTAATQSTNQTAAKYYRCNVTCTTGPLSTMANSLFVDVLPAPVGNSLANAIIVGQAPCATQPYTNTVTNDPLACYVNTLGQSSPDVYYQFTLAAPATVDVAHCGSGFDTYVHILDNAGNILFSNDDNGPLCAGTTASIQQALAAGTYYVMSEGFSSNVGAITTSISTTDPCPVNATLNLTAFLEGYVTGLGTMNEVLSFQGLPNPITDCDDVTVELHDATTPYAMVETFTGVLQTNGTLTCTYTGATIGNSYYIVVKNRNHMETWSAAPVTMAATTAYNFSTAQSQAFGTPGNLVETPLGSGQWAMYSGDINQDLSIDAQDYLLLDPDIVAGNSGYLTTDLNGDGSVDALDYLILDPNISAGITIQAP